MLVVINVGTKHLNRTQHFTFSLRQNDAAVLIVHLQLWFQRHGLYSRIVHTFQFARHLVNECSHAPCLVARLAFCIIDKGVAESEHGLHAIDGGCHRQLFFVVGHTDDFNLACCQ